MKKKKKVVQPPPPTLGKKKTTVLKEWGDVQIHIVNRHPMAHPIPSPPWTDSFPNPKAKMKFEFQI